jgi:C4-dicarboxylate-specific signal transduction histidine kinase
MRSIHPEDKTFVEESWIKAFKNEPNVVEYRIIAANRVKWVSEQIEVKFKKEGELLFAVGIIQDITERKESEEELREIRSELLHSTRNRTLVELTAALAHELNHPLGSILNNANAAKRYLSKKKPNLDEIRDIIDDIISEDRRATDVMQKVRALMKHSQIEFFPLNINLIIEEVLKLTQSDLIIKNISMSKRLGKNLPTLKGDYVQLQQVFLNLIINATDAVKESKVRKIQISTTKQDSEGVIVCVRDSGTGFDEKDKEKLFNPFFTTKKEGMGMGLSVVKTIIKSHGGDIRAENNEKSGASFFVSFNI